MAPVFLSTLSLRRATFITRQATPSTSYFYPRSPCGERPYTNKTNGGTIIFLSTLSLRRATQEIEKLSRVTVISIHALLAESDQEHIKKTLQGFNFYPRSPCGERQSTRQIKQTCRVISIHALLAESDQANAVDQILPGHFYPRSPCGERRL